RGTTEAINLIAQAWGRPRLQAGDEILISALEHHANIVPWQMLCEQTGCTLKVAPINRRGELQLEEFLKLLSPRTRLVAVAHVSNALGTVLPVKPLIDRKSTRLNSSHVAISYAVFCLKKKKTKISTRARPN